MAYLTDFLPRVLPYLPECSQPMALQALIDTITDFCKETQIWQVTLTPVDTMVGVRSYPIVPPVLATTALVHSITRLWYLKTELGLITPDSGMVTPEFYNTGFSLADISSGYPHAGIYDWGTKSLILNRPVQQSDTAALTIRVALFPDPTAAQIYDALLTDYQYAIGQGAIARLASIPGQLFTNPGAAAKADMEYRIARSKAKARANSGSSRAGVAIAMRRF